MKERESRERQWAIWERQTARARDHAQSRLEMIDAIELLVEAGLTKTAAIDALADIDRTGRSTINSWFAMIDGVDRHDRLAYLVPRWRGGGRRAEIDPKMLEILAADYHRPGAPTLAACIVRLRRLAELRGIQLPHSRTIRRHFNRIYDPYTSAMMRGEDLPDWLRRRLPANDR